MQRRIALLVAALVVALAGTTLIFLYFNQKTAAATEQEASASVLMATALIPEGTTGQAVLDQGLVELTELPARAVAPGALTDLVPLGAQVTTTDIQPGEQLLGAKFIDPARADSLAIPDDKVAVSVDLESDAQRVANYVGPGSEVAVFGTYAVTAPQPQPRPAGSPAWPAGSAEPVVDKATSLVLDRALVLAVGAKPATTAPGEAAQPAAGTVVTLALSIEDAQEVAHAAQTGSITLGLLTDKSRTGTAAPDDTRTLFD